jgi:hypothetical protein
LTLFYLNIQQTALNWYEIKYNITFCNHIYIYIEVSFNNKLFFIIF